ncbi:hypothetical protein WNY77_00910 [Paraglaciecola mesophila]|uniref:ABC-type transport auxiliary lipoprotein component domain-containing protein n=1 Tax=Paraglaciecola mesophila TaxID=197222 RepID=A0ABU9SPZ2_9ALTE
MNGLISTGHWAVTVSLICFSFLLPSCATADESLNLVNPAPLIGITGVDDFMSDIEEPNASAAGAMGMQRFFTTKMVGALNNCVSQTGGVFVNWYSEFSLLPVSEEIEPLKMKTRIWDKERKGIFEAHYLLDKDKKYMRVSLDYYRINGEKVSPASINSLITTYQLNSLWTKLSEAMECDAQ